MVVFNMVLYAVCLAMVSFSSAGSTPHTNRPDCLCPQVIDPVCGVNGQTFNNNCERICAGVPLAHPGRCRSCMCPQVIDPVCGVNGQTFNNNCDRNCAGVPLAYRGRCGEPPCPPGIPRVNCARDPCTVTFCRCFPRATCLFDNCGGCVARFFIGKLEVTKMCQSVIIGK